MFPDRNTVANPTTTTVSGTHTVTLSLGSAITIPHGLGKMPAWADANSANTLSAVMFTTTWDATNIYINLLAPLTGQCKLNWAAVG